MSLKDIGLKVAYDSDEDDILNSFYIPALSESVKYYRLTGFFSSSSLALSALGIINFINNGGEMKLVASIKINRRDKEAIEKGIEKPEEVISKFMTDGLDEMKNEFIKDHLAALAWMIATKKLEIKVAIMTDKSGSIACQEDIEKQGGIFHQKVGLLEDKEGNILSFSGSVNETAFGWTGNIENFDVFRSWVGGEIDHLSQKRKMFEKFWDGRTKRAIIYDMPDAIRDKIIQMAPRNLKEFKILSERITERLAKRNRETLDSKEDIETVTHIQEIKELNTKKEATIDISDILREYQKTSIDEWFKNDCRGIFEMATGTGKTEASIGCLNELIKKEKPLLIVVVAYGKNLVIQWIERLKKYGFSSIGADSDFPTWRIDLSKTMMGTSLSYKTYGIVVTSYQTFCSKDFVSLIKDFEGKLMIICDEVHHVGAEKLKDGLIDKYEYRLGLSATPERWFDEEGTAFVRSYFGKTVYKFSMKRAIEEINPLTEKTFLCGYRYYPIFVNLSTNESDEYIKITKKIAKRFAISKKNNNTDKIIENLLRQRANIIKNAEEKIDAFSKILDELKEHLKYCIIYCSGNQMNRCKDILNERKYIYHEFTQYQKSKKKISSEEMSREELIDGLAKSSDIGGYDILLAIKCLNEGIDIPSAKIGIFLESSSNPIEFIQRRGRLLRQTNDSRVNKHEAIMYDFIVIPTLLDESDEIYEMERKLIQKEFDRFVEFAHLANNSQEVFKRMENIINRYNLIVNIRDE